MYSFPLDPKSESKCAVVDVDIPLMMVSNDTRPSNISAFDLGVDDLFKVSLPSLFVPCSIVSVEPRLKIVTGNVFTTSEMTTNCSRRPVVYIYQSSSVSSSETSGNGQNTGCFTTFKAVACWNPPQSIVKHPVSLVGFQRRGLLALSSDGTMLKYLPFAIEGVLSKSESFQLPAVATGIWSPSGIGFSLRRVLFLVSTAADINNSATQRLVISDVDQVLFTGNSVGFQLLPKEQVLDVIWGADESVQGKIVV